MSKKLTSVLVLAAAMLLSIPAQAQTSVKKKAVVGATQYEAQQKLTTEQLRKAKADQVKADDAAKRMLSQGQTSLNPKVAPSSSNVAEDRLPIMEEGFGKVPAQASAQSGRRIATNRTIPATTRANAPKRHSLRAGTVDDHGIIREPEEGVHTVYKRVGTAYFLHEQEVYYGPQTGTVELVETGDGTVYVKNIISYFVPDSWVKGTKSGNTLTIPTGQPMEYYPDYNSTVSLYWGTSNDDSSNPWTKQSTESITFTIEDDMIRLQGSSDKLFVGAFWDVDNTFSGFGDYNTVWANPMCAVTAGNIDVLPYINALGTAEEFSEFGTIDVNQDDNTWLFSDKNITCYSYSSTNDADDWLVSPAIKLDAGKEYHFSIEASCQSAAYPEHFEVRAAQKPLADALAAGVEIVPTTVVDNTDFTIYENYTVKVEEPGYYHIGIHCTSPRDLYLLKIRNFTFESLTAPEAVSDLTVTQTPDKLEAVVSFKAPVKDVAGNDLQGNISKIEVLRNGEVVKTLTDVAPGSEQTVVDQQPTVGWFTYQVIPYDTNGQDMGEKSEEISVLAKSTIEVPFSADLSDPKTLDLFDIIDNNSDNSTWQYDKDFSTIIYLYNEKNNADDYLVTLPVHLKAGQLYTVKVNANARDSHFHEHFEVVMGKEKTAAGLSKVLIGDTELTSKNPEDFESDFTVEEEGEYYIAIHATSDANSYCLILHSFDIMDGPLYTAPAAPRLAVEAAPEGALSATVSVTAPAKNIQGDNLTGNLKVDLYRDGNFVESKDDVAPGAAISFTDVLPAPATYMYQAVAANEYDYGEKASKVRRYVGIDIPTDVDGTPNITETGNGLHLTWNAVGNVGRNGGYVNPAEVVYNIWNNEYRPTITGGVILDHQEQLTSVTGETSADIELNTEEGEQTTKYLSVVATSSTGASNDTYTTWVVGKSYELPFRESFQDRTTHYFWTTNGGLMSIEDAADEDGFSLRLVARELPESGIIYLGSGKLNIKDVANPTMTFNAKSTTINTMYVYGNVDGGMPRLLATVQLTGDYKTIKVPLTSLKNGKYAQFTFLAEFEKAVTFDNEGYVTELGDFIVMDDIRVVDLYDYNLAIQLDNPSKINAGKTATIRAIVENKGEQTVSNYTVDIKVGGKTLYNETISQPLPMFALNTIEADFATSIFDEMGDMPITAEVKLEGEMKPEDNTAEGMISVLEPKVSAPNNLTAQVVDEGVNLNWDVPAASSTEILESFEDTEVFPEFSIGGITATEHHGHFGDWKLYDGNGRNVYGFPGYSQVPNLGYPSAWLVMNPSSPQLAQDVSEDYGAHSGTQYLISSCPAEPKGSIPPADHWLISPQVSGKAQTITFYVRSLVTMYGSETYEVLASSTNDEIESFQLVTANYCSTNQWEEVKVDLPEGTQYFAIRHTSPDVWGMMLDDITYEGVGADLVSYNIYFQNELVATVTGEVTTYLVPMDKLVNGEDLPFGVTAVYADGAESLPATVYVTIISQDIRQIAADGQPVDIYTLDGRLVRSQAKSLDGLRGVYVINGQKVMVK